MHAKRTWLWIKSKKLNFFFFLKFDKFFLVKFIFFSVWLDLNEFCSILLRIINFLCFSLFHSQLREKSFSKKFLWLHHLLCFCGRGIGLRLKFCWAFQKHFGLYFLLIKICSVLFPPPLKIAQYMPMVWSMWI